ncbi:MAG: hypothetical protein HYV53_04045 [Parcubacteria group bacterium]|nr:hypothetical protein [Parcubacteria group bacterium]
MPQEKISQKEIDIFCRELLADNPKLKSEIVSQMQNLMKQGLPMPVIHITSRALYGANDKEINTNFIENIEKNGFRKRDTNVGVFVKRDKKTSIAQPDYYTEHPNEFIKSLRLFFERYIRHGIRTNKSALGDFKDSGTAIASMIIIDGNVSLERGSDYDDHYILKDGAAPDQIIGAVDLKEHYHYRSKNDITYIAEKILKQTNSFYEAAKSGAA